MELKDPEPVTGPFCHHFRSADRDYIYDVHTNALLEVEPALVAVMPLADLLPAATIQAKLRENFTAGQVVEALASLDRGRAEGLFCSRRPQAGAPTPEVDNDILPDQGLQHLVLTVTEACNLRCRYCMHGADLNWVRGHGNRAMSRETAFRAVDYFLDRCDPDRKPVISFYGGEPLLEIDLITAVVGHIRRHRRGEEAALAIDTNGIRLDRRAAALIHREHIHLQVSLDGPPEIHDRYRRSGHDRPTHATVMAGLRSLLAAEPALASRLIFVVTLAPPFDLPAVNTYFAHFPLFRELGILRPPRLRVNFSDLAGQNWPDLDRQHDLANTQLEKLRRQYLADILSGHHDRIEPVPRALFEADLVRFHRRSRRRLGTTVSPGSPCSLGRRKLHVDVDGKLQPCERTGWGFPLGTLQTGIQPARVQAHESSFWRGCADRCSTCWAVRLCGLCHAHLARCGVKALSDLPETECRRERRRIEDVMIMMVQVLSAPPKFRSFLNDYILE